MSVEKLRPEKSEPAWTPQLPTGQPPPDPNAPHHLEEELEGDGLLPSYEAVATSAFVHQVAEATADGRVNVRLGSRTSKLLARFVLDQPEISQNYSNVPSTPAPVYMKTDVKRWTVSLNVLIQVVGSRGDVQPFIALGTELQRAGHRVRLATHDIFETFVMDSGLEFFPIGGDPADLMAYMVKNPALLPSIRTMRDGDIQKKRTMVAEMLDGFWSSCIEADPKTGAPFVAEAIIANPPGFAHIHCAQALGVPLHMIFTMPWSRTKSFPHPLANIIHNAVSSIDIGAANYLSYGIVEWMTWQGLGDVVNKWRARLDLEPVPATEGPSLIESQRKPFTYCWSPALVPKPKDWPPYIDVCGFFFRDEPKYEPPPQIAAFLAHGPPPVYIGFGSIVIDDPIKLNNTICNAIKATGVRAIISKGWAKLGAAQQHADDDILYIDDCPHEWLFQKVSVVIHHGGSGTTACGLLNGAPTVIVPFFGDQPFWGNMVAEAGAGPNPIHFKTLTSQTLAEAIRFCLQPEAKAAAQIIAAQMKAESGVKTAVASFHRNLPLARLSCDVQPQFAAVWIWQPSSTKQPAIKLSSIVASILLRNKRIHKKHLNIYKPDPLRIERRRYDILTGFCSSIISTAADTVSAIGGVVLDPIKEYKRAEKMNGKALTHTNSMATASSSTHFSPDAQQADSIESIGSTSIRSNDTASTTVSYRDRNAGKAAVLASVKSIARIPHAILKGVVVTVPSAVADGMRYMPRLYGDTVVPLDPINGLRSGIVVAGRGVVDSVVDAVTGVVLQPYMGYKAGKNLNEGSVQYGIVGGALGLGRYAVGVPLKVCGVLSGIVAYPLQGAYKSLYKLAHMGTEKMIQERRFAEGEWNIDKNHGAIGKGVVVEQVLKKFDELMYKGD